MQPHEQVRFIRDIGLFIVEQIKAAQEPLLQKVADLEMKLAVIGATTQKYHDESLAEIEARMAALPVPKDGQDGMQGPAGKDGRDGTDGIDGKDGKDAPSEEFIRQYITGAVEATLSTWDKPKDGKDGCDGVDGQNGAPGADGAD